MSNDSETKKDIFDRVMHRTLFRRWEPLYLKYKEPLLYLFFGGLSFLVSIGSFSLFVYSFHTGELLGNVWSWVCAVLFAYITNRTWVFENKAREKKGIFREIYLFFSGRLFTLLIEEVIIYLFITRLGYNAILVKTAAQVVVIVLNYIISKALVFRKKV